MNPSYLIGKKRDGGEFTEGELADLIRGYLVGDVSDAQMAAWAMAVCCRGMSTDETAALTWHMLHSGVTLQWPAGTGPTVDKHSTGGVGDKVSLPLAGMLAACGLRVPMLSGRGLGATGGTLDKLDSISGIRTDLSLDEFRQVVDQVGCVISGTTAELAPADKKIYALRDVTGTVESIPLITASIMSKKLAEGLDALVLDVKHGSGAFMKHRSHAQALARSLVETGRRMGVATVALVTDMQQPLGRMVGHAVEVDESLALLTGQGPADLQEVTLALGSELLVLAGVEPTPTAAKQRLLQTLSEGTALEKFSQMVTAQGGDLDASRPVAPGHELLAQESGYLATIDTQALGRAIIDLGGGRRQPSDRLDLSVGLEMLVRLGEPVDVGQPLLRVFAQREPMDQVRGAIQRALTLAAAPLPPPLLIAEKIG